jgi:hypothetical protein
MLGIAPEDHTVCHWLFVVTADHVFLSELYSCMPNTYLYTMALLNLAEPLKDIMDYIQAQVKTASSTAPISFDDVDMQCLRGDVVSTSKVIDFEDDEEGTTSVNVPNPIPNPSARCMVGGSTPDEPIETPKKRKVADKKGKGKAKKSGVDELDDDDDDADDDDDVQQGTPKNAKKMGMDAVKDRLVKAQKSRSGLTAPAKRGKK